MKQNNDFIDVVKAALKGFVDVFFVPLIITDTNGKQLTSWFYPSNQPEANCDCLPNNSFKKTAIKNCRLYDNGEVRKFSIFIKDIFQEDIYIQSGLIPNNYRWIDDTIKGQNVSGQGEIETPSLVLLNQFILNVCKEFHAVSSKRSIDNLDIENIRRLGICFQSRLFQHSEDFTPKFSLQAIPSLKVIFMPSNRPRPPISRKLSEALRFITSEKDESISFNVMSLAGDLLIREATRNTLCTKISPDFAIACLQSDIKGLIKATFLRHQKVTAPVVSRKCHLGFSAVLAPVFVDGLIVGFVLADQLITSINAFKQLKRLYLKYNLKEKKLPAVIRRKEISEIKKLLTGLATIIEIMFEEYCQEGTSFRFVSELINLKSTNRKENFAHICEIIKNSLTLSDCSIFEVKQSGVMLSATSAKVLYTRNNVDDDFEEINREDAIGRFYYNVGSGVIGKCIEDNIEKYHYFDSRDHKWVGHCSEIKEPHQFFIVPITCSDSKRYGAIRAIRPASSRKLSESQCSILKSFAWELAMLLHNEELTAAENDSFKHRCEVLQTYLAEIAHEYRSPLHNILSLCAQLKFSNNSGVIRDAHENMKMEVYRAKKIINNYLVFGTDGKEEIKYNPTKNSLYITIRNIVSRNNLDVSKKGGYIKISSSLMKLPQIYFDGDWIDQAFDNIIKNAIKYSFDYQEVEIDAKEKANTITVSISDMGLGIPKKFQKMIFEGYQRSVEDQGRFKPGTGLGLMIAHRIVLAHNGTIEVNSVPVWNDSKRLKKNEGYKTTFTVSLPKLTQKS